MWKSNKTLERQLESGRNQVKQLKETIGTLKRSLENQVEENKRQKSYTRKYHEAVRRMVKNEVKGYAKTLDNLNNMFKYARWDDSYYGENETVERFLLKVLNEIEKESLTVRFSEELLQVITNNYER